jgi:TonB family protein
MILQHADTPRRLLPYRPCRAKRAEPAALPAVPPGQAAETALPAPAKVEVRPDGTVASSEVVRSSHRGLNAAAEAAVLAWRFKPTGQTLPGQVELRFE